MPRFNKLTGSSFKRRSYWIDEIVQLSGHFGQDSSRIEKELKSEIKRDGLQALLDHLRLCGSIPEKYGHDSSEEKLYSKYTDALLSSVLNYIGLSSIVLTGRADTADVEAVCDAYSLVGDAKVFRLSRTAKNQKDFKVEALHQWKRGKQYALVVSPIYQLPTRNSQIYQQAIARTVCVFSYSHLAVIVRLAECLGKKRAIDFLHKILDCMQNLNPCKDASSYWLAINSTMLSYDTCISDFWRDEKAVTVDSIKAAKEEALLFLAQEREAIMRMSKGDAIEALINHRNINGRCAVIQKACDNGIFSISGSCKR